MGRPARPGTRALGPPGGRVQNPWLDVTVPLHAGMVVYEGDPPLGVVAALAIWAGDAASGSRLTLGSHTGTHVDAPRHFIPGAAGVDALPPAVFLGPARVLECPPGTVEPAALSGTGLAGERRLIL